MKWTTTNIPNLNGKMAIVTGASSGLGWEVTNELARHQCTVIMACRDKDKGELSKKKILDTFPAARLNVEYLDLSDIQSIVNFSNKIKTEYSHINLLINNAATLNVQGKTKDGFELIFGTNHLGTFALTAQLLPLLEKTNGVSRIITVGSDSHKFASLQFNELDAEPSSDCLKNYARSKLANMLFAFELDRRLEQANKNVISLAAHPGYAKSHLSDTNNNSPSAMVSKILSLGMSLFAQSTQKGALPILYAATANDVCGGDYIGPDGFGELRGYPKKTQAAGQAKDENKARQLWDLSEEKLKNFNINFNLAAAPLVINTELLEERKCCGLR